MPAPLVVYQGVPGAYSEAAARQLLGKDVKTVGLDSFEKCFQALEDERADFAMMPIENSMGGSVHDCFDLQLRFDFNIVAELDFRVRHCLMALPGTKKEDVTMVISHYQALAQCEQFMNRNKLVSKKDYDTAGSAKKIFDENLVGYAAIASELAAVTHNLEIIERDIEDDPNNVTRFFLLSKKCLIPPTTFQLLSDEDKGISYKTAVVLSFTNTPGALCRALSFFAKNGLDLLKLESRPNKYGKKGRFLPSTLPKEILDIFSNVDYTPMNGFDSDFTDSKKPTNKYPFVFYIDILGSISEHKIISALKQIASFSVYFRVLGSFPRRGVLQQFVAQSVNVANNSVIVDVSNTALENSFEDISANDTKPLKLALIGFGNFGQFLAKTFVNHHKVVACNRSDQSFEAMKLGVKYYNDPKSLLTEEPDVDVVVVCVAILAFEKLLKQIPPQLLQGKVVVDVLSVKAFPKTTLLNLKLEHKLRCGILCTHPMFGPESGKYSWKNLPMVFEKVMGECTSEVKGNAEKFLKIFQDEGCRMVEMSCEEHDHLAANSQFITHFLGRSIDKLGLEPPRDRKKEISTTGFKSLMTIRDQTVKDSFDLFSALYIYNSNSRATVNKFSNAMADLLQELEQKKQDVIDLKQKVDENEFKFTPSEVLGRIAPSQTGEIFGLATKLRLEGKDIIMGLCVGQPDFAPPKQILEATKKAVDDGHTTYTTVHGVEPLRQAIADDLQRRKGLIYTKDNVSVNPSGKQSLFLLAMALLQEGDEVIVPAPHWTSYPEIVKFAGATPVIVERDPKNGFIMTKEQLEKALTPRTKMMIFCNPCNPTGCFYSREQMEDLAEVLRRPEHRNVIILSDEIYERLVFDGDSHTSFASLEGLKRRTVIVNGFSKAFAMTGYRLGYIASEDPKIISWCGVLQSQINSCASAISQQAGIAALNLPDEVLAPLYHELQEKRDLICSLLMEIPKLIVPPVKGAFYVFPDVSYYIGENMRSKLNGDIIRTSTVLCLYLIEHFGVALVAGDAFGAPYGLRLSFATSKTEIRAAVERLKAGLASLEFTGEMRTM